MILGRRTPGRTGVVDQDVDIAHALQRLIGQAHDLGLFGAVSGNPARINTGGLQLGGCLFQIFRLARTEHDFGAGFAQRMRQLQAQAARAAGNQGGLARQIEKLLDGASHGVSV